MTLLKAQSYLGLGDEKSAFETVDKAIKLKPYNPFCYIMKSMLYQDLNKMDEAEEYLNEAFKLDPEILIEMIETNLNSNFNNSYKHE